MSNVLDSIHSTTTTNNITDHKTKQNTFTLTSTKTKTNTSLLFGKGSVEIEIQLWCEAIFSRTGCSGCTFDQRATLGSRSCYSVGPGTKLWSPSLTTNALTQWAILSSSFFGKNSICIGAIMKTVTFSFKIIKKKKTYLRKIFQNSKFVRPIFRYLWTSQQSPFDFIMAQ